VVGPSGVKPLSNNRINLVGVAASGRQVRGIQGSPLRAEACGQKRSSVKVRFRVLPQPGDDLGFDRRAKLDGVSPVQRTSDADAGLGHDVGVIIVIETSL